MSCFQHRIKDRKVFFFLLNLPSRGKAEGERATRTCTEGRTAAMETQAEAILSKVTGFHTQVVEVCRAGL